MLSLNGHFKVEFTCLKQARRVLIKSDELLNQKLAGLQNYREKWN